MQSFQKSQRDMIEVSLEGKVQISLDEINNPDVEETENVPFANELIILILHHQGQERFHLNRYNPNCGI